MSSPYKTRFRTPKNKSIRSQMIRQQNQKRGEKIHLEESPHEKTINTPIKFKTVVKSLNNGLNINDRSLTPQPLRRNSLKNRELTPEPYISNSNYTPKRSLTPNPKFFNNISNVL